jgi:hypothetical protein
VRALNRQLWAVAIVVLISIVIVLFIGWHTANARSALVLRQAEDSLKREIEVGLPAGSDNTRVEQFPLAHSMYTEGFRTLEGSYRAQYGDASGVMFASTDNIKTTLYSCKIVVTILFNDDKKLLRYTIQSPCNGPF